MFGSMILLRSIDVSMIIIFNDGINLFVYVYCIDKIVLGGNDMINVWMINFIFGERFLVLMYVKGDINVSGNIYLNYFCFGSCVDYKLMDLNIFGYG